VSAVFALSPPSHVIARLDSRWGKVPGRFDHAIELMNPRQHERVRCPVPLRLLLELHDQAVEVGSLLIRTSGFVGTNVMLVAELPAGRADALRINGSKQGPRRAIIYKT
jgi:hypothetical protein